MKKYVYRDCPPYTTLVRVEDDAPDCGIDFCDRCGDCLSCYGSDPCSGSRNEVNDHLWVVYEEEPHE